MTRKLYKEGSIIIPKYIENIVENVSWVGLYTYKLKGINRYRPSYGIYEDVQKLKNWAESHGAEIIVKEHVTQPNNYYLVFEMTDPIAHALEKAEMIK